MGVQNICLVSESPRRLELMHLVCPVFTSMVAPLTSEDPYTGTTPKATALARARAKAELGQRIAGQVTETLYIGCDTVVDLDGEIFGKPRDEADARHMLKALSGREHSVHTGVCLLHGTFPARELCESTQLWLAHIPDTDIESVLKTDEPYDKAGAYGIQGWAARYVLRIAGCYYNVMGLPVASLYSAIQQEGFI